MGDVRLNFDDRVLSDEQDKQINGNRSMLEQLLYILV